MKPKKKLKAKREPPSDGFHWEEWRNGRLIYSGYHDGTELDGKDASAITKSLRIPIPYSAIERLYK